MDNDKVNNNNNNNKNNRTHNLRFRRRIPKKTIRYVEIPFYQGSLIQYNRQLQKQQSISLEKSLDHNHEDIDTENDQGIELSDIETKEKEEEDEKEIVIIKEGQEEENIGKIQTPPPPPSSSSPSLKSFKKKCIDKLNFISGINELYNIGLYRAAITEMVGTALFMFMSIAIFTSSINYFNFSYISNLDDFTLQQLSNSVPNYKVPILSGLLHIPLLFLLILACAPVSGGHLNPSITLATFFAGYTSFIRCIIYMIAQIVGGVIGSAIIKGILPNDVMSRGNLGMCSFGQSITPSGALGLEFMLSLFNLYVSFGTALDPRQTPFLGPITGSFFISGMLCLSIIASGGIAPNYIFGFNIARCLSPAIVLSKFENIWPYMVGPIMACLTIGVYIHCVPPFKSFNCSECSSERKKIKK
ncbi:hypothetical protein ACTFIY_003213 [Dictyostelium cf. discoideum]